MGTDSKAFWRKKRVWIPASLFIFLFLFPFFINLAFRGSAPFDVFAARWGAGDVLAFYGATLTTIVLIYVAYWQTKLSQELNELPLKYTEASLTAEHAAIIAVDSISFEYEQPKKCSSLRFLTQSLVPEPPDTIIQPGKTLFYPIAFTPKFKVLSGFVSSVEVEEFRCDVV